MTAQYALAAVLILLQLLDMVSTYLVISNGGYETNKGLVWLADKLAGLRFFGRWSWLFWTKMLLIVAIWFGLTSFLLPDWLTACFGTLCVFYTFVVSNNFGHYAKQVRKQSPLN